MGRMESGRFESYRTPAQIDAQREDVRIRAAFTTPEGRAKLFAENPVTWLKGAIGLQTERGASEVPDRELMVRYVEGGRFEWNPEVARAVATYLKSRGFQWTL